MTRIHWEEPAGPASLKEKNVFFQIVLLFDTEPMIPFPKDMLVTMGKYFGPVEMTSDHDNMKGFYLTDIDSYEVDLDREDEEDETEEVGKTADSGTPEKHEPAEQDGGVDRQPFLMVTELEDFHEASITPFERSQMWDVFEEKNELLASMKYQLTGIDFYTDKLSKKRRTYLVMDFMEALLEIYPEAKAVYFPTAGKLIKVSDLLKKKAKREERFISYAMNVRIFRPEGTDDHIVDTLGLYALNYPDVQYHFHGLDPIQSVRHAYMVAAYILDNDNPVKNNEAIISIGEEGFNEEEDWFLHYENAMVQPDRKVVDVQMGKYASGGRYY